MKDRKILSMALALFISTGIITACSTNTINSTIPNSSNSTSSNSSIISTDINSNTNLTSSDLQEQVSVNTEIQSELQDDEMTIQDSEIIAQEQLGFSTLATKDDNEKLKKGNLGLGARLNINLNKKEREKILEDRINIVKKEIKLNEAKLKLLKDVKKFNSKIKRKNVNVKNSDVVEIKNADGTTSKIMTVKFENNTENNSRENKIIKTFSADGKLIRVEHYLTINLKNLDRTYSRIADINPDGSRKVVIKSETKWANGKTRVLNEERTINADGSGTGTGTITVTNKDGLVKTYNINITIAANGNVIVNNPSSPLPSPSVTPSLSPEPSSLPSSSVSPSVEPSSSPIASATPVPSPTATVEPSPSVSPSASPSS